MVYDLLVGAGGAVLAVSIWVAALTFSRGWRAHSGGGEDGSMELGSCRGCPRTRACSFVEK